MEPAQDIPAAIQALLREADIALDGGRPWDIRLHRPGVMAAVMAQGSRILGEAYVRGDWDCEALDDLFTRLISVKADRLYGHGGPALRLWKRLVGSVLNLQSIERSTRVARQHYDIPTPIYVAMLDPWLQYSCGYWEFADSLEEAQEHKLHLICRKLQLRPGLKLLDIGCGWGGLAAFAARHYGVEVVGITLSAEQLRFARERWPENRIRFERCDYRHLPRLETGRFDRVVSVGMYEHVGRRNGTGFFRGVKEALKDEGLFLLHTIGYPTSGARTDPWIDAHIFPHGQLPSPVDLTLAFEDVFLLEDWHNFGADYDRTLVSWQARFAAAWPALQSVLRDAPLPCALDVFPRFWRYYLLSCAAFFRARQGQVWQLVLSPQGSRVSGHRSSYRSFRLKADDCPELSRHPIQPAGAAHAPDG
jgi:cyclopropane-fatty-acyl-phospholipid synthase